MSKIISQEDVNKTVVVRNNIEVVRSDALADMFTKQHKDILKIIRQKVLFFSGENIPLKDFFIEETAITSKGRKFTRFYLTRKGFDFIGLSLQGKKADLYKFYYINAFHDKQRILEENKLTAMLNKSDDLWVMFREEGKVFRNKLTKAIHEKIVVYRNDHENKQNDGKYYYHYTSLIYKVLGIELPKGTNPRDVLDKRMLVRLEDMEDKVSDMIMKCNKYYKDCYRDIKKELNV